MKRHYADALLWLTMTDSAGLSINRRTNLFVRKSPFKIDQTLETSHYDASTIKLKKARYICKQVST